MFLPDYGKFTHLGLENYAGFLHEFPALRRSLDLIGAAW
jgi:hypothetical protein